LREEKGKVPNRPGGETAGHAKHARGKQLPYPGGEAARFREKRQARRDGLPESFWRGDQDDSIDPPQRKPRNPRFSGKKTLGKVFGQVGRGGHLERVEKAARPRTLLQQKRSAGLASAWGA